MGKLVEGRLPSLFGGVSRQPDAVRRSEQVEAADNVLLSVTTGGFEKRPNTQYLANCASFLDATADYAFHSIDRDTTEQYFVLVDHAAPDIFVINAITGAQVTVDVEDSVRYFAIENSSLGTGTGVIEDASAVDIETQVAFASGETAFAWNWKMSDGTTGRFKVEGSADGISWVDLATGKGGATTGSFSTTIGAAATNDHNYIRVNITTGMANAADTLTLYATFKDKTYLLQGTSSDSFKLSTVADTTFVLNRQVTTRMSEADGGTITGTYQAFSDLPAASGSGNIHKVIGDDTDGFGTYFVKDDTGSVYREWYDPTAHNNFAADSLPHVLARQSDGTFHFSTATWGARAAGDETLTPEPEFIGLKLQDCCLYRNRLAFIADEQIHLSRVGEPFELFPQKAIEVLDNDPVVRGATTNDINILKVMTVFKKVLFCSSIRNQFELSSTSAFTPTSAVFDLATSYPSSPDTRPAVMGDNMYYPGVGAENATIYEYFFDEATLSNTAADVTKHCNGYIKNDVKMIEGDATSNTLFVMTTNDQNRLYVYKTYFDNSQKLQSAWSRYEFGPNESEAFIYGYAIFDGFLVMLIERGDGGIYLEQMPIEREDYDTTMKYIPLLDQRDVGTGTYNAATDATYWTTNWDHEDTARVVIGPNFAAGAGAAPATYHPSNGTITLATVTAGQTFIAGGLTFTAHATTTTAANREFSISGNDVADAGTLHSVLSDATYGVTDTTWTDNGDGTISYRTTDYLTNDTLAAFTGTAISGATITDARVYKTIAIAGDWSANQCYFGRTYTASVELSKLFVQEDGVSALTGRLSIKDITFRLVDAGYLKVTVTPEDRTAYEYEFEGRILGDTAAVGPAELAATFFKVPITSDGRTCLIVVTSDEPLPCVVTSAAWRGFFNENTRQE
jgi:hypothetical protein